MEGTRHGRAGRQDPHTEERETLLEGLARTRTLLAQAYASFNSTRDPYLIDSCVFEINALQARYSYLLRRVKALDGYALDHPARGPAGWSGGRLLWSSETRKEGCV